MTTYNFNDFTTWPESSEARTAEVWVKSSWSDAWTLRRDMIPVMSTWAISPQPATASVEYRYGRVQIPGETRMHDLSPITDRGYYVLIRWEMDNEVPMNWIGFAETPVKQWEKVGDDSVPLSGMQVIPCYGLESAFRETYLTTVVHANPDTEAEETFVRNGFATVFNETEKGNRTKERVDIGGGVMRHVFANPGDDSTFWSTRDIVEYLMTFQLPTNNYGVSAIPWGVDSTGFSLLPNWDRPTVSADGRSVSDLLDELLNVQRLTGWMVGGSVSGSLGDQPTISRIDLLPFTRAAVSVSLPSIGNLLANPTVHTISATTDPKTEVQIDVDDSGMVDELIVQGPREIAVCTIDHNRGFLPGWTPEQQTDYAEGPEGDDEKKAFFANSSIAARREMNASWRADERLRNVYSDFVIKPTWDGNAGHNLLGANAGPVFRPNDDESPHVPFLYNCEVMGKLPLFRGVDYTAEEIDESKGVVYMDPLLMFRVNGVFLFAENTSMAGNGFNARNGNRVPLTIRLQAIGDDGPGFRLDVSGGPRHAVSADFVGNSGDTQNHRVFGDITYATMRATIGLMGDRRPSWTINAGGSPDLVRRKVITLEHPSLMHVRIAKGTILGVNHDRTLKRVEETTLRNPETVLRALATLAAETYLKPRMSVRVSTGRRVSGIYPGSMIGTANGTATGALVREVRIDAPTSDGNSLLPVRQTISATTNEIDIVSLMGRTRDQSVIRSTARPVVNERNMKRLESIQHAIGSKVFERRKATLMAGGWRQQRFDMNRGN